MGSTDKKIENPVRFENGYRQTLPTPDVSPSAGHKRCDGCSKILPLEEPFWHKDGSSPDGYRNECKVCRNAKERQSQEDEAKALIESRQKAADIKFLEYIESLPRILETEPIPHSASLYERIMHYRGGADGLARHWMMVYLTASPAVRARMLKTEIELGIKTSDEGHARLPVESMTTEDLKRELDKRLKVIHIEATKPDAKPPEEPPKESGEGDVQP